MISLCGRHESPHNQTPKPVDEGVGDEDPDLLPMSCPGAQCLFVSVMRLCALLPRPLCFLVTMLLSDTRRSRKDWHIAPNCPHPSHEVKLDSTVHFKNPAIIDNVRL
jgi:hypothetical protein